MEMYANNDKQNFLTQSQLVNEILLKLWVFGKNLKRKNPAILNLNPS